MNVDHVLKFMIGLCISVMLLAVFAIWQDTTRRATARRACDALNGVTVHLRHSQSLCFVNGRLIKVSP